MTGNRYQLWADGTVGVMFAEIAAQFTEKVLCYFSYSALFI